LARELFRRHTTGGGLDVVLVPRREMVHAPFANLESDFRSALNRCRRGSPPAKSSLGGRRRGDKNI
jgi:RNase P protein component